MESPLSTVSTENLDRSIESYLRDALVYGVCSPSFGLRWNSREDSVPLIAGWLCVKKVDFLKKISVALKLSDLWKHKFCSVNDAEKRFDIFKLKDKEKQEVEIKIPFSSIEKIISNDQDCCIMIYYRNKSDDERVIEIKPIENSVDTLSRWGALLRHRTGLFNKKKCEAERERIVRKTIFLQATYRGYRARQETRMSEKRRDSIKITQGALDKYLSRFKQDDDVPKERVASNATASSSEDDDSSHNSPTSPANTRNDRRHSQHVRFKDIEDLQKLGNKLFEVEDEIWENQKWVIGDGWINCDKRLTDRLGNPPVATTLEELEKELPAGWELSTPLTLDKSAHECGRCDEDGWQYQLSFGNLDSDTARSREKSDSKKSRWLARRRRFYRRRTCSKPQPTRLAIEGFLGIQGVQAKRWKNRYCILVSQKPAEGAVDVDDSHLSYVLDEFPLAYLASFEESDTGYSVFRMKKQGTSRKLNIKAIDNECFVDDSVAARRKPGYFYVYLTGEKKPRLFNAGSTEARVAWVKAFKKIIANSGSPVSVIKRMENIVGAQTTVHVESTRRFLNTTSRKRILVSHKSSKISEEDNDGSGEREGAGREQPQCGGGTLKPVDNLKNLILEIEFDVEVDVLFDMMYRSVKFSDALFKHENITEVIRSAWSPALVVGGKRNVSYLMPRRGAMPSNRAYANDSIIQMVPGAGYQIDSTCSNPDVPYGKCFKTAVRTVLLPSGNKKSKFILSQDIVFIQSTIFKTFIVTGSVREMKRTHEKSWIPFVKEYIKVKLDKSDLGAPTDSAAKVGIVGGEITTPISTKVQNMENVEVLRGQVLIVLLVLLTALVLSLIIQVHTLIGHQSVILSHLESRLSVGVSAAAVKVVM